MGSSWLESVAGLVEEVAGADFGDRRLGKRAARLVEALGAEPGKSLPQALKDESQLEAAYRFFNNEEVTPERILEPHIAGTVERMRGYEVALALHDTTTMSFRPDGQRQGLGRVRSTGQAFFAHMTLAVAGDGTREPLGVLGLSAHVRDGRTKNERDRWGEQIERIASRVGVERQHLVHVIDREADDYRLLALLTSGAHRFVVRAAFDRLLANEGTHDSRKLQDELASIRAQATREVPLSQRAKASRSPKQLHIHPVREGRLATLAFGATTVTLRRPTPQPKTQPATIRLNVVRVWEPEPPAGESPVEWILLTREPIDDAEQLLRIVDHYRARWTIEEYFKALKTGCAYQKRQLESLDGLLNVLALYAPIAWKLLRFRNEARRDPQAPAITVLTETQIEVLRRFRRKPLPEKPTARDVLLAVAALGGHLKRNGEPGWQTLAAGYDELTTLTAGWEAAVAAGKM
jgi:hypothetical protein